MEKMSPAGLLTMMEQVSSMEQLQTTLCQICLTLFEHWARESDVWFKNEF